MRGVLRSGVFKEFNKGGISAGGGVVSQPFRLWITPGRGEAILYSFSFLPKALKRQALLR